MNAILHGYNMARAMLRLHRVGWHAACLFYRAKPVRKELVKSQQLKAVIFMQSGVFKPYADVSTDILIFGLDDVLFHDMRTDGFSLDGECISAKANNIPNIIVWFHSLADTPNQGASSVHQPDHCGVERSEKRLHQRREILEEIV